MKHFIAYAIMAIAVLIGGGSLLLFGVFLVIGPIAMVRFCATEHQALLWDGLLSLLFFIQHSGMMRTSFRTWLAPIVPRYYHPSTYAGYNDDSATRFRSKPPPCSDSKRQGNPIHSATPGRSVATLVF